MSVEGRRQRDLVAEITVRTHQILSDVELKLGGQDTAPDPHDYVQAALAACTIITCQMYANRKGWPLISTDVKVSIVKEGPETTIAREIAFRGDLDADQRARLTEIANKCPIHRLLESRITIDTKVIG